MVLELSLANFFVCISIIHKETPSDVKFHLAAVNGRLDVIRKIIDSGRVHVDCKDKDGTTPLILCVANGHFECAKELLNQGADPNARRCTGTTALFFASQNGFTDLVSLLLEHGAKVDRRSSDGASPLFVSCQCGHTDVCEMLLLHGADPNANMKDGATPLFIASQNGHYHIVAHLIANGAKINGRRLDGTTPLWMAAQMGNDHICKVLLQYGAYVDATRLDGTTPLFKACHKGHASVVEELLKFKPNLSILSNGESCLHVACLIGNLAIVKQLVRAGADPFLLNVDNLTPYQLAETSKHYQVVKYLNKMRDNNSTGHR